MLQRPHASIYTYFSPSLTPSLHLWVRGRFFARDVFILGRFKHLAVLPRGVR